VYAAWFRFFGGDAYAEIVATMRRDFERVAGEVDRATEERLAGLFRTGVRLERGFWDMAYSQAHWPDARVGQTG
jgi:thiaminase